MNDDMVSGAHFRVGSCTREMFLLRLSCTTCVVKEEVKERS